MISSRPCVLAMTLALGSGPSLAQTLILSDPMRPPAYAAPAGSVVGEQASGGGLVLQSTLLSRGRRIAVIDGRPMKVGDRIGEARIISIDAGAVTLREAKTTRILQLYPGVEVTSPAAAKPAASRSGAKEGAK